jgi:nucleoside-diphosphate-sugar epimerase
MILVAGATGILGGMITQRLLGEGREVRILVRHNSPAEWDISSQLLTHKPSGNPLNQPFYYIFYSRQVPGD